MFILAGKQVFNISLSIHFNYNMGLNSEPSESETFKIETKLFFWLVSSVHKVFYWTK